jgi:hypothetical protein
VATHLESDKVGIPAENLLIPKPLHYVMILTLFAPFNTFFPKERHNTSLGPRMQLVSFCPFSSILASFPNGQNSNKSNPNNLKQMLSNRIRTYYLVWKLSF